MSPLNELEGTVPYESVTHRGTLGGCRFFALEPGVRQRTCPRDSPCLNGDAVLHLHFLY